MTVALPPLSSVSPDTPLDMLLDAYLRTLLADLQLLIPYDAAAAWLGHDDRPSLRVVVPDAARVPSIESARHLVFGATAEAAREIFTREVVRPAFEAERGLRRLWNLCDLWLGYVEGEVFRGGCFFAAAAAEFDSRPGPAASCPVLSGKRPLSVEGLPAAPAGCPYSRSISPLRRRRQSGQSVV